MILVSCAEDDLVSTEPEYHDAVLIKCAVADYITEASDMTRGMTRGMAYDDDMITKLDLLVFEAAGNNKNTLLKHLSATTSASDSYTWDITGQMPKDFLRNKNLVLYLVANYYPEDHNGIGIETFNPTNANTFFIVSSEEPFPPGKMLEHGIVMAQVVEGTKHYTTDTNGNLIMEFNTLERVMAKAEFIVSTYDDLRLVQTVDFENENTFTDGWAHSVADRTNVIWGERTIAGGTTHFLNAINKYGDSGNNGADYYYTITNEEFRNAGKWRMEFDFAGLRSNQHNKNSHNPQLNISDILTINYNENPETSEAATWAFDNGYSSSPVVVKNGTLAETSFEIGSNINITGSEKVNYTDANGISHSLQMTTFETFQKHNSASDAQATSYFKFTITPDDNIKFRPTKLSLKSARSGTGGGYYDIYLKRGDEEKEIMIGYQPERRGGNSETTEEDNDGMDGEQDAGTNMSISELPISNADLSNGAIEIWIYVYSLDPGRKFYISDIAIEGEVDKTSWAKADATITLGDKTGGITLDQRTTNTYYDDFVEVKTWYHLDLSSDGTNVTCKITDANGNSMFDESIPDNYSAPSEIRMNLARYNAHWAIDNIKLYASKIREISEYKVQNYTNGYTLFNVDETDKSTETEIRNKADVAYTNTGFSLLSEHPETLKDAENNSFAFYFYPNYWFDEKKKTNMAREEPIIYGRQTHVLVKASYQDKQYYYKVPVNYRLPKYSDAHQSTDHFNSKIDEICDTQYPTTEEQWTDETSGFYKYVLDYLYYTYETCSDENKEKLKAACKSLYNAASTAGDKGKAKTAVKDMIGGTDIYAVFKEKNITEAERLCRIQRNHHYKVTVNIDKPGGETADEAVYIMPAPYGDITARPEF